MKEFLIELQALLKKHNAVIFFDPEDKLSFEVTMGMGAETCFTHEHVIDSNDINLYIYEHTTKSI